VTKSPPWKFGTLLVHGWYSLCRHCIPRLYKQYTNSYTNRQKQSKDSKNSKNDIGVPIVTCLPRLYQPRTNNVPKTVNRQLNRKKSPLVYQSSHVYSKSAEYTKSASAFASAVRRPRPPNTQSQCYHYTPTTNCNNVKVQRYFSCNRNLAIANRSRVTCAHNTLMAYRPKYYAVTLKCSLRVTQGHWKRNQWIDHTWLTISRVI